MKAQELTDLFSLKGRVAIVTGGTGVLGGAMAAGLAAAGAHVAILGRRAEQAAAVAQKLEADGGSAMPLPADVLDTAQLTDARQRVLDQWGRIDVLINAAGGNSPDAIVFGDVTFFNMKREAFQKMIDLNLTGSLLPSQVFGEAMAEAKRGSIINISSMASQRVLTRVIGYSAAKAGIDNFTRWLAVEMAHKYGEGMRVNAIAPGFFIGEQNRDFLLTPDGSPTPRGQQIVSHTPMDRFGEPDELIGAAVWLASDASKFVTGIVVPVDGGFSAFGGV
ncbi:MAG TPA: SDR family oxidoreductase [Caldilineaceae bacterium]|nr:SDR family oxidoreductase [Caldilineaceae bacterium]